MTAPTNLAGLADEIEGARKYPSRTTLHLNGGTVSYGFGMKPHPADGMVAYVDHGDGAVSSIVDPRSFTEGGPEWVMRYGNIEGIRYSVASLLGSYDYLLSDAISLKEAVKRLALMRRARARIEGEGG